MTARRARLVAALVVALSALPAGTAHATGTGRVTSPASGATLTSPVVITVEVTGQAGTIVQPRNHDVQVRLADHTGAAAHAGTQVVAATCQSNCDEDSTWTVDLFDPATLAPFASAPSCNGGYTVQAQVDGGSWSGNAVRIGRAPGAPRDVAVTAGVEEASITWGAAPDPDVVGYRVERRRDGGAWTQVASLGAGARSATDGEVEAGSVEYRVVTLRGDGLVSGRPAAPCTDDAPDLATPSAAVATTVRSPATASPSTPSRPSPSSSPTPGDDGSEGGGDGGSDGGGAGSGDGDGDGGDGQTPADGDQPDDGQDGTEDGAAAPVRRPGNRVAPPSRVDTMSAPSVDVPGTPAADGPQVATQDERYYGEGDAFSEEIEYGDLGEVDVDALADGTTTTRVIRVPGALQAVLGEELAVDRVLAPVAAGMIMLAFGLHLRRWTREGLED